MFDSIEESKTSRKLSTPSMERDSCGTEDDHRSSPLRLSPSKDIDRIEKPNIDDNRIKDEDATGSNFDDYQAATGYTNGNSNLTETTYYTTDPYTTTPAYFNNSIVIYSQGVNQLLTDNAYLVVDQTDPSSLSATNAEASQRNSPQTHYSSEDSPSTNTTKALLINPTSLHNINTTDPNNNSLSGTLLTNTRTIAAIDLASVVSATNNSTNATAIVTSPGLVSTSPTNLHLQNVRDMDVVHVKWLVENYETAEGVSLPRSTLYSHYQAHCQQHGIEPVNAASFGKLIRSVFLGLRTRRLGTRGNSKYHYYGIRVKPGSILSRLMDNNSSNNNDSNQSSSKRLKSTPNSSVSNVSANCANSEKSVLSSGDNHQATLMATSPEVLQTYLGDPDSILPNVWPEEPTLVCNDTDSPSALATRFAACYRKHYEQVITAIGNLNFSSIEGLWRTFWQAEDIPNCDSSDKKKSQSSCLTLEQLHQLTSSPRAEGEIDAEVITSLADWIIQTDYTLYNSLISSLLLPNLLKPIPQQLTQQIRNFAKNINNWMISALLGYDQSFIALKLSAVIAFSHTLRRYTSLNHLSSAARAVLQNQQQVQQMINDLNRVDFKNVQEQASWVCQCEDQVVEQIEQSFKQLLQELNPFDKWGHWCEQVLDMCLQGSDVRSSTQFFFKWGFYSSLVMRDLTLRSASSFGSFHLIRLLFDEYIFYLIEHRVAKVTGKTPLQVLGEARSLQNQASINPNSSGNDSHAPQPAT